MFVILLVVTCCFDRRLFNSVVCSMHLVFMCLLLIVYMF